LIFLDKSSAITSDYAGHKSEKMSLDGITMPSQKIITGPILGLESNTHFNCSF